MRTAAALATLLLCACATPQRAAPRDGSSPLAPLAWLSGTWVGGEGSTYIEESWSEPQGVSMLGSFRMLEAGAPRFYELMSIEYEEGRALLRLKHFGPKLLAWEEKAEAPTYRLGTVTPSHASFENVGADEVRRIRYVREGDALFISLERDGQKPQEFRFRRAAD